MSLIKHIKGFELASLTLVPSKSPWVHTREYVNMTHCITSHFSFVLPLQQTLCIIKISSWTGITIILLCRCFRVCFSFLSPCLRRFVHIDHGETTPDYSVASPVLCHRNETRDLPQRSRVFALHPPMSCTSLCNHTQALKSSFDKSRSSSSRHLSNPPQETLPERETENRNGVEVQRSHFLNTAGDIKVACPLRADVNYAALVASRIQHAIGDRGSLKEMDRISETP